VLGGVVLPPLQEIEQLVADFLADGAAQQHMLGAVDLRRLAQDRRAAVLHQQVEATPSAGLAVMPENPSEPPHCRPSVRSCRQGLAPDLVGLGNSCLMRSTPARTVALVPPVSWMVVGVMRLPTGMPSASHSRFQLVGFAARPMISTPRNSDAWRSRRWCGEAAEMASPSARAAQPLLWVSATMAVDIRKVGERLRPANWSEMRRATVAEQFTVVSTPI